MNLFNRLPGFPRTPAGKERVVLRQLPKAFLLGTLLLRSKIRFPQVVGPSVPDLQPLAEPRPFHRRFLSFLWTCLTGVRGS